jgi:hypothetical protein
VRIGGKIDIGHDIRSLVTPISDNGLRRKLELYQLLPMMGILSSSLHLVDLLKTRFRGHEFENAVHAQHCTKFGLHSSSFEATPNLQSCLLHQNWVGHIEESWSLADLLKIGLSEGRLDNDVQELVHHVLAFMVARRFSHVYSDHRVFVNHDEVSLTLVDSLESERLVDLGNRVNDLARADVVAENSLHLSTLTFQDLLHKIWIPKFHRLNIDRILKYLELRTQFQPVLVRDDITLPGRRIHLFVRLGDRWTGSE